MDRQDPALLEELEALRRRNAELMRLLQEKEGVEEALRQSEARYRAILEDQTELICRFRPDGALTYVNEAYCRYFDKTRDELMGKSFVPLVPEEDQRLVAEQFGSLCLENPIVVYEHRVIRPDGSIAWQRWTDRALFDAEGSLVEYQAVGIDVTEQHLAVAEVQRLTAEAERAALQEQIIEAQRAVIRDLSTPLLPIADHVVAMPLVGTLDSHRAAAALETLLQGVVDHRATTVLLDVTGVSLIDSQVADALFRAARAVRLLGAEVVLTGLRPHVAQTLVSMGIEVRDMVTLRSLKDGIAFALRRGRRR